MEGGVSVGLSSWGHQRQVPFISYLPCFSNASCSPCPESTEVPQIELRCGRSKKDHRARQDACAARNPKMVNLVCQQRLISMLFLECCVKKDSEVPSRHSRKESDEHSLDAHCVPGPSLKALGTEQ